MFDPRLQHAVAVAREGSFTRASVAIGVTQPAITKSVADLEQRLGYQLFIRTARGTKLTEEGRAFVDRAARILDDARELMNGPPGADPYSGVLRIGICPASLEWLVVESLALLVRKHPAIRLEVVAGKFETMVQSLRTGTVDIAFGFEAAFHEWPDLDRHPIADLSGKMFVKAGHPLLSLTNITSHDLARYDFISPSESRPYGTSIRNIYKSQGVEWRERLHVMDYFPAVREMVLATEAIGVIAAGDRIPTILGSKFVVLSGVDLLAPAKLSCATRSRWSPRPAVKAFIQILKKRLGA